MGREGVDSDFSYTPAEQIKLARNLGGIYADLDAGRYVDRDYRPDLICEWHGRLFRGVRDGHAGRHRAPDFGFETHNFGPNTSLHRDQVPRALTRHCQEAERAIREAVAMGEGENPRFALEAIRVAAYVHAELIRIHPFIDGNGRVGRLLMDWIWRRAGFTFTMAFDVPRQEYIGTLNHYYETGEFQPHLDMMIRMVAAGLG